MQLITYIGSGDNYAKRAYMYEKEDEKGVATEEKYTKESAHKDSRARVY